MDPNLPLMGMASFFAMQLVLTCLLSYAGAQALTRYANRLALIDQPNFRSSHKQPIPRGGGIAVLLAFVGSLIFFRLCIGSPIFQDVQTITLIAGSCFIGLVGLIDDARGLSPKIRLVLQATLALLTVIALAPLPIHQVPFFSSLPNWFMGLLAFLGLMWWLNLYNFMDGLDGLASSQTLHMCVAGLFGLVLTWYNQELPAPASTPYDPLIQHLLASRATEFALLSACSLGFLFINWHPAKIFLGDSGSLSQAYLLFVLAITSIESQSLTYQFWLITGALFVVDATYTLLGRVIKRARLSVAHREHTYQQLFDSKKLTHAQVTSLYGLVNLLVLLPLALASLVWKAHADYLLVLAYGLVTLLIWIARKTTKAPEGALVG